MLLKVWTNTQFNTPLTNHICRREYGNKLFKAIKLYVLLWYWLWAAHLMRRCNLIFAGCNVASYYAGVGTRLDATRNSNENAKKTMIIHKTP